MSDTPIWPTLKLYSGDKLRKIALPLGGIGTGTVSLGGKGDLKDWEIMNRPGKGFQPQYSFFMIRVSSASGGPIAKVLEGPIDISEYEGEFGTKANHHGMPRFKNCSFGTAYPFGQVNLSDENFPVTVKIKGFNPLIPTDVENSSLPLAILSYVVTNVSKEVLEVSVAGSLQNFIGEDGSSTTVPNAQHPFRDGFEKFNNTNSYVKSENISGILFESLGVPKDSERFGTVALAILDGEDVSYKTRWADFSWGDSLLEFWDDFLANGKLTDKFATSVSAQIQDDSIPAIRPGGLPCPVASLSDMRTLSPGESKEFKFLISWNFPNRHAWQSNDYGDISQAHYSDEIVGNHYTNRFTNAWDSILKLHEKLPDLEKRTLKFVGSILDSEIPAVIQESALFNLSTLRSQTFFQTADGHYFGWEGTGDRKGSCHGSCTHVWNYEQVTPHLFGSIARDMREIEFLHMLRANGMMSFRVGLPLEKEASIWHLAAADGQMGCIVKLFREWKLSGDNAWLSKLWGNARKSLEFCWLEGGWDADQDGVMEGCQHNTMDVEYYGPNPQMGFWYLAALKAASEMAMYFGESDFVIKCQKLFDSGSKYMDEVLFNGDYFHHKIIPTLDVETIHPGLRHSNMGASNMAEPELQLGDGCLVDQLVGQFLAHICGLGYLSNQDNQKMALSSIRKWNHRDEFYSEFNHMRNFVLGDEKALLVASYPQGNRPLRPFPYFSEVMTGFEYTAAVGMIYEDQIEEGLEIIKNIRERYDGLKRNPFDEAECGHHYVRAMASWAGVLAWTGQEYDGRNGKLSFSKISHIPTPWFVGDSWGTITEKDGKIALEICEGILNLSTIEIKDTKSLVFNLQNEPLTPQTLVL